MGLRKPAPGQQFGRSHLCWDDHDFAEMYPNLSEFLFAVTYEDGSRRITATMTWYVEGEALIVVMNDRDNNRSAFVSAPTLASLFDSIEKGLAEESLEWRSKKQAQGVADKVPW